MSQILIIEDEPSLASALTAVCKRLGHTARSCASGRAGLEALAAGDSAVAILDIGLPDLSGLDVLKAARVQAPQVPVIIITAHGNLDNAVAARQLGAAAYLVKPLDLREVEQTIQQVLANAAPAAPAEAGEPTKPRLLGGAPGMQRVFLEIAHATTTDAPVLLSGATGTGKTLAARVIHEHSARAAAPFVVLHCGALPEQLLESELFGHEKGSFTGALMDRPGHIERARGGTLFLDEIGDIAPAVQAKLLRFVEERSFTRVGGREDIRVELRLITATNRNLREEVAAGRFREDLFYRLHVLEIAMPPLRERRADLPMLAENFLKTANRRLSLAPETVALLVQHDWPGNLRELRNALEHAAAVCTGPVILPTHLPRELRDRAGNAPDLESRLATLLGEWLDTKIATNTEYDAMHDALEAMALRHLLAHYGGKPTVLARELNMNRVTLRKKLTAAGIRVSEPDPGPDEKTV
uniref:Two component sigma54 specific transcriptional regulator Fis family n=1 Tax=uncultured Verrucomicrobiota bacterium TaxID=156588 RepID=D2DXW7_9BACT|nr:two component sigma54 specific transcriptional regulator Fis family [uncultured Verrucomicrobiota bacterium]